MSDHSYNWAYPFSTRWEKTCALLNPQLFIPEHKMESGGKRVSVRREWIPNFGSCGAAGWTKEYAKAGCDLRAFNMAELLMLQAVKAIPNCYRLVKNSTHGTQLHNVSDSFTTTDMGPTVYDWQHWPVRVGGERKRFANLFEQPGNFVRLARAGLQSLSEIHDKNIVHMDYRTPNFCLALKGTPTLRHDNEGSFLQIQLDWSSLKAIDFGFSISRGNTPYTLLPLARGLKDEEEDRKRTVPLDEVPEDRCTGITLAAHKLITDLGELGENKFSQLSQAERNQLKASQFLDVRYQHNFWTTLGENPLNRLCAIDWREDCYQFGKQLQAICAQPGLAAFLKQFTFTDKDKGDTDKVRPPGWVAFAFKELPEQLIALGKEVVAYPALGSPEAAELEQRRKDLYRGLIRKLDIAIRDMPPDWSTDEVLIFQSDIVEPHAGSAPQPTDVRPPVRRFPWKKTAAVVAGSAALLAALPSLQAWTKTPSTPEPVAEVASPPQPAAKPVPPPQPTPEELAARRAAEDAAKAAQAKATALAAWRKQAAGIEQTAWWQRNAGKPTPAQLAWVRETQRLAKAYGELDTLIDLAALPCTGRAAPLIRQDSGECGRQVAAILTHQDFNLAGQSAFVKGQVQARIEKRILAPSAAHADLAFAANLLPGLLHHVQKEPGFAFVSTYIQGCLIKPIQVAGARGSLDVLLKDFPDSGSAKNSRELQWSERLQRGQNLCEAP